MPSTLGILLHMLPRRHVPLPSQLPADVSSACVGEWEQTIAASVKSPHAVAVNSGRRAMTLILQYFKVSAGTEVIIPAYTLKDLVPLIQQLGARVIPVDIDEDSLTISPSAVEAALTERSRAILVLHTFGTPCRIAEICDIAARHNVPVIEDCAHSIGAKADGQYTGTVGDAGFYSFETTKPINTFGGGMVVSRDAKLVDAVRQQTQADSQPDGILEGKFKAIQTEQLLFRTNLCFPMLALLATPFTKQAMESLYRRFQHAPPSHIAYSPRQAQLGLSSLPQLPARMEARRATADRYRQLLDPCIHVQTCQPTDTSTWYFLVVTLPCPAAPIRRQLLWRGIDAGVEDEVADDCAVLLGSHDCPVTNRIYRKTLALPIFDGIDEADVSRVATTLNRLVRKQAKVQ